MPTIDWPEPLIPQTAQLALRKAGTQFASPFNGTLQALDFIAERWVLSASLAQMAMRNPRGVDAFCNRLAGGVERVRVWPFHTGGVPRGTLRGAVTLAVAAARGGVVLRVQGALSATNLIANGGMEVAVADLAVGATLVSQGATGTVSVGGVAGAGSARAQAVYGSALGTGSGDYIGIARLGLPVVAGRPYALAADLLGDPQDLTVQIRWLNAGGGFLSASTAVVAGNPSVFQRASVAAVAPPGAGLASLYLYGARRAGVAGLSSVAIDNVQFEQGGAATAWAGLPTLRAGDFMGAGGQLFQVASDCTLLDDGSGDIPILNRVRGTIAISSPVTWYRPSCEMVLPAMQAGPVRRPGVIESTALDLVEVW